MHSFTVSDVRVADRLLPAIAVDHAIARRIAEPLGIQDLFSHGGERTHARPPALAGLPLRGDEPPRGVVRNDHAFTWPEDSDRGEGPTLSSFPIGLSRVPLVWDYLGTRFPMTLQAGFVGISQDPET